MKTAIAAADEPPEKKDTTMAGSNAHANDQMIRRLETELRERETFANGVIERAQSAERDLNEDEKKLLVETRGRMEQIKEQIINLEDISRVASEVAQRARVVDAAISNSRSKISRGPIEYRSAGAYALDLYRASQGHREARERLEVFERESSGAVDHMTTTDLEGIIPDPVVQPVINWIDDGRPLVAALGPRALPSETWHRPRVTQHTAVGEQTEQKTELVNQRMKVERIPVSAKTYGGYCNVARQVVDFSTPSGLDLVIQDLASQYAVETEAVTAAEVAGVGTTAIDFDGSDAASVTAALWTAVAQVFSVTKGQGNLILVCSPNSLGTFGPLFPPINPQNAQSEGFTAARFRQGIMGNISGVTTMMSSGFSGNEAFLLSTAAVEIYEQRGGTLQVTEPSVLGIQVAYYGYFAALVLEEGGVVPLNDTGSS